MIASTIISSPQSVVDVGSGAGQITGTYVSSGRFGIGTITASPFAGNSQGAPIRTLEGSSFLPLSSNPYNNGTSTPSLPGLVGGADGFGLANFSATDALSTAAIAQANAAKAAYAVLRLPNGFYNLSYDFVGYDLIAVMNVSGKTISQPTFGLAVGGSDAGQVSLKVGGYLQAVPVDLQTLQGGLLTGQVWVTAVPSSTAQVSFNASGVIDGAAFNATGVSLLLDATSTSSHNSVGRFVASNFLGSVDQTLVPLGTTFGGKSWQTVRSGIQLNGGNLDVFVAASVVGNYVVTASVSDGQLGTPTTRTANIQITNVAPTLDLGLGGTAKQGRSFTRSIGFKDPGVDPWVVTVDYDTNDSVAGVVVPFDLTMKTVALDRVYAAAGSFTVGVSVFDGTTTTSGSFVVVVTPNILPTVVEPISNLSVREGFAISGDHANLARVFGDADGLVTELTYSIVGNTNTSLFTPRAMGSNLGLTFNTASSGVSAITVRATDIAGGTVDHSFSINVSARDTTAPTSLVQPLPANATSLSIPLTVAGSDPAGPAGSQVVGDLIITIQGGSIAPNDTAVFDAFIRSSTGTDKLAFANYEFAITKVLPNPNPSGDLDFFKTEFQPNPSIRANYLFLPI